jgi:hypothetical protein
MAILLGGSDLNYVDIKKKGTNIIPFTHRLYNNASTTDWLLCRGRITFGN